MINDRTFLALSGMAAPILMLVTWLFAHAALTAWPRKTARFGYSVGAVVSAALSAAFWIATYARI